jgi:hypothetical protein
MFTWLEISARTKNTHDSKEVHVVNIYLNIFTNVCLSLWALSYYLVSSLFILPFTYIMSKVECNLMLET